MLMKTRLFIVIIFLIVTAGLITYLLIPSPLVVSDRISFNTSSNGAYRTLIKQENWDKWSPETFYITKKLANTIELDR